MFKETLGVFELEITSPSDDFDSSLQAALDKLEFVEFDALYENVPDVSIALDLCVFFDTVNCSVDFLEARIAQLARKPVSFQVSCYPTSFHGAAVAAGSAGTVDGTVARQQPSPHRRN